MPGRGCGGPWPGAIGRMPGGGPRGAIPGGGPRGGCIWREEGTQARECERGRAHERPRVAPGPLPPADDVVAHLMSLLNRCAESGERVCGRGMQQACKEGRE